MKNIIYRTYCFFGAKLKLRKKPISESNPYKIENAKITISFLLLFLKINK